MQFSCKKSLLVICQIFTLFLDTLNDDDKYSLLNKENFNAANLDAIMPKRKMFFLIFFLNIWNLVWKCNIFKNKDDPHNWCNSKIMDSEWRG